MKITTIAFDTISLQDIDIYTQQTQIPELCGSKTRVNKKTDVIMIAKIIDHSGLEMPIGYNIDPVARHNEACLPNA